eukprot:COSAG05_NODE_45_length_25418_cov_92.923299_28_plen_107_part_01
MAQDPSKRAAVLDVANSRHFRGRQQFGEAATRRAAAGLLWTQPRYPAYMITVYMLHGYSMRVRLHKIRTERTENVGKSQSCMVSELRIICRQTVYMLHGYSMRVRLH